MTDYSMKAEGGRYEIEGPALELRRDFSTEAWQFFAFVFAALTTLTFALLDELPRPRGGFWICQGVYLSPPALRVILKVLVFVVLGYLMLFCPPAKTLIIRVLPYIKRGITR